MLIELLVIAVIVLIVWLILRRRAFRYYSSMNKTIDDEKVKYREMKRQMTSNIAHELRTPVSSIRGYLETLSTCKDIDEEHRQMFIDRAYAQAIRLSDLIRDIALLTEIEVGRGGLGTEKVSVREVFSDALEEFKDRIQTSGDYVENLLPHSMEITANKTLLTAIFSNLVENSLKYAGDHVTIHIECTVRKNGDCAFKYYDTGVGVPAEHRKRIFERFYRVSEGRTRDAGGSGLGLSIVRNSVVFHGGEIEAVAHHGGGLEYRFTLKDSDN
ncbi:MAG: ATP-binding protein [Bacteroidales bacterium]|nr:ATP-binding protein [Bacteroidales bacterium]